MKTQLKTIDIQGIKKLEELHKVVGGTLSFTSPDQCLACGLNGSDHGIAL